MAILPIRNLGNVGVVTDVSPYNLPINGFTRADNVMFEDGKVKRAPVFKRVFQATGEYSTATMVSQETSSGIDEFFVCDRRYVIGKYTYPTFTDMTNATYLDNTLEDTPETIPVTATTLADVIYFAKEDRRPIYKVPSEAFFRELHPKDSGTSATGVTSTWGTLTEVWKCKSLRSYGDFLIALSMTEGSDTYPSRVRWCDPTTANTPALKWDETDTTSLAGFNDLVQIDGPIIDGLSLGNQFIIYSKDQVWLMDFVGGQFVFNFRRLFVDSGVINQNSVVEVEGKHFVFGQDDIYTHNGSQKQSIVDNKVRDFIFNNLDTNKNHVIFVHHDVRFKKIFFCYKSVDSNAKFDKADHCNKALVFNYMDGTCSFMDLPNLTAGGVGNLGAEITYNEAGSPTYESLGGGYVDQSGSKARQTLFTNDVLRIESPSSATNYPASEADSYYSFRYSNLLTIDDLQRSMVVATYDDIYNADAVLERTGIDLDETGGGYGLNTYRTIKNIFPQMVSSKDGVASSGTMNISVGAADLPNNTPNYSTVTTFLPSSEYKVDSRASGRYLSYKITTPTPKTYFEFSGFDTDFMNIAKR